MGTSTPLPIKVMADYGYHPLWWDSEHPRIASREMLPDCWLLPHLICSRHLWVRSKSDEVDQRDDEK